MHFRKVGPPSIELSLMSTNVWNLSIEFHLDLLCSPSKQTA